MTPDPVLTIGALVFDDLDQIDLTGPFEVFSQLSHARVGLYGLHAGAVRDAHGLRIDVDAVLEDAPRLDVLHVPGGPGQDALMRDARVLNWLCAQAETATCVFSVCTGALLLGAAGLLAGRRATTHWSAMELLAAYGAEAVDERVVVDGDFVFAAGVTAGLDGALRVAARLRGEFEAQTIQLLMAYAPEPPFSAGTVKQAPVDVVQRARAELDALLQRRRLTAGLPAQPVAVLRDDLEHAVPPRERQVGELRCAERAPGPDPGL